MHGRSRRYGSGPSVVAAMALLLIVVVAAAGVGALLVTIDMTRAQLAVIYHAGSR